MADKDEDAFGWLDPRLAGFPIFQANRMNAAIAADDFLDDRIPSEADFFIAESPLLKLDAGAKLVAAVDDIDAAGEAGQEERLFDG